MVILHLADIKKTQVQYVATRYPDGQQDIVIDADNIVFAADKKPRVIIQSRLNSFKDLELILCATKALRNIGCKRISLFTPYIMGLRSDRLFQAGGTRYIKDIIAPILNAQNYEEIKCIDPHSDVAQNCIDNLHQLDNVFLVQDALRDMAKINPISYTSTERKFVLISPDAGASKKIHKVAEAIKFKGEVLTCSKTRDVNGNLSGTIVPITDSCMNKDFVIIDDICDGGRTFINIAEKINEYYNHEDFAGYKPRIYLIVTHGIFSAGFKELNKYFWKIYCTNSVSNLGTYEHDSIRMKKLKVKQFDVF